MTKSLISKWARLDSNQGPKDYESLGTALTACFLIGRVLSALALKCPVASQRRHSRGTAPATAKFQQWPAGNGAPCRSDSIHGGQYTHKRSWRVLRGPALVLCLLAGCAATPPEPGRTITTTRHELDLPALVRVCNKGMTDHEPDLNGCYEWIGGVCHIYTLPRWVREIRDGDASGYHRTLGHELDHCQRGAFHGADRGVLLPRSPVSALRR